MQYYYIMTTNYYVHCHRSIPPSRISWLSGSRPVAEITTYMSRDGDEQDIQRPKPCTLSISLTRCRSDSIPSSPVLAGQTSLGGLATEPARQIWPVLLHTMPVRAASPSCSQQPVACTACTSKQGQPGNDTYVLLDHLPGTSMAKGSGFHVHDVAATTTTFCAAHMFGELEVNVASEVGTGSYTLMFSSVPPMVYVG